MNAPCKSELILVARLIARGDVQSARILRSANSRAPSVAEARALMGALKSLKKRYDANIPDQVSLVFGDSKKVSRC